MSRVFVVNRSGHDFSNATKYGELVFLSEGAISRYATTDIYRGFAAILDRDSEPNDYILITGLTVMSCIACMIMTSLHGKVNMLMYRNGNYVDRTLVVGELLNKQSIKEELKYHWIDPNYVSKEEK